MKKIIRALTGIVLWLVFLLNVSFAQSNFYEGKTIRIIVGFSPGGGYDALARMLSRHMGKYIPGQPTIVVENMTGAGSLLAANHIYKVAKPDGLTMGHFSGGFSFNQVMGQPGVEFDARKFVYVGAVARDESAIALTQASGITSMEKWMAAKTPVKMGTTGPGAFGTDNVIKVVKAALNLPIQIISGYKGTADMRIAAESGEIDGTTWGWDSMRGTWQKAIESGTVVIVLQTVPKPFADLPNVPLAIDLAKTPDARQLIEVGIHYPSKITKTLALPPGTPDDRAQMLQKALQETVKDKQFIAEADKAKLGLNPVTADDMKTTVDGIFKLDPGTLAKLKTILF
ncbi:MAG: tripartite tricarboxylate transporter substrate-binding protein [Candidatus Binatia bacterium]